jgi:hypothetical protein
MDGARSPRMSLVDNAIHHKLTLLYVRSQAKPRLSTTLSSRPQKYIMSVQHKIYRTANAPTTSADETETNVAQALVDLENNVPELKSDLRPLQISAAREVDVRGGKKAIVVFVPVPQLKAFRKVQQRCVQPIFFAERQDP